MQKWEYQFIIAEKYGKGIFGHVLPKEASWKVHFVNGENLSNWTDITLYNYLNKIGEQGWENCCHDYPHHHPDRSLPWNTCILPPKDLNNEFNLQRLKTQLQKRSQSPFKIDRFKSCPQCLRSREECFCGKVLSL